MAGSKRCTRCLRILPIDEFYRGPRAGSRVARCRHCLCAYQQGHRARHRDRINEQKRGAYKARASAHRDHKLQTLYGLTRDEYDELLRAQGGLCAICRQPERTRANNGLALKTLAVDHDHETGRVRGLLCAQCNKGLGNLGDSVERLRAAIAYLEPRSRKSVSVR